MSHPLFDIGNLKADDFKLRTGEESRQAALEWDKRLGFETLKIEEELYQKDPNDNEYESRAWMGLPFQTLQTPYSEILAALEKFKKNKRIPERVIDFGAAYGRVGLIVKLLFPNAGFLGLEMVKERVEEARRVYKNLGLDPEWLQTKDILDPEFEIPRADIYFLYDFSDPADIKIILNKLSDIFFKEEFFLIAKGKAVNSLIQHKYPQFFASHGRCWLEHAVIYSSSVDLKDF